MTIPSPASQCEMLMQLEHQLLYIMSRYVLVEQTSLSDLIFTLGALCPSNFLTCTVLIADTSMQDVSAINTVLDELRTQYSPEFITASAKRHFYWFFFFVDILKNSSPFSEDCKSTYRPNFLIWDTHTWHQVCCHLTIWNLKHCWEKPSICCWCYWVS